jgi:archaellum component FlaF (FlaF/FlaG flagellin family)
MNNIADESQMTMDARKYYIQSYDFTMLGYLIDEEEFQVKPAIARVSQVVEVDTSLIRKKRNKFPENPSEFLSNFLYVSGITSLSDIIDFTADMTWIGSENISNFDVFINGDYFGSNVNKIQITTNDLLTITVTKNDNTQEGIIKFDCNLV